jgi:hypothetical protein
MALAAAPRRESRHGASTTDAAVVLEWRSAESVTRAGARPLV